MLDVNGMLSFFMLGSRGIPMQLTPTKNGCQLLVQHETGVITECFETFSSALRRAEALNRLMTNHRRARRSRKLTPRHRTR